MNQIRRGTVDVDGMKSQHRRRGPVSIDGIQFTQKHYKFCLDCLSKEDISGYEWILDRTDDGGEINNVIYSSNDGKSQKTVDLSTVVNYWLRNHVYSQTLSKLDDEKTTQLEMEDMEREREEERKIQSDKLRRELLFSIRDYIIKMVKEELVKRGQ